MLTISEDGPQPSSGSSISGAIGRYKRALVSEVSSSLKFCIIIEYNIKLYQIQYNIVLKSSI